MELRQLNYFIKVAESLSFSDAAKEVCVTQSTLSQQIKQLETELDTPLFVRSSHKVELTEAGELLLPYARRVVNEARMCMNRLADLKELNTGSLDIGVTYSFSPILTETLMEFMKRYPNVKLNICYKPMADLMEMLTRHSLDFVLAFKPIIPIPGVESHILFQNALAAVVGSSHPLARHKKVSLPELEKYDLALPSRGLQARNYFDTLITPYTRFRIRTELNEVNILLKIVRQSNLVTILAEDTIYNEPGVTAIPIDVPNNVMEGCVHTLKDSYHKQSMKIFLSLLNESIAVKERQNSWI